MLNLIRYGICHPKFLGSYIVEKTYKIVLVLVTMFILVAMTIFGLNVNNTYLTQEEALEVYQTLLTKTEIEYSNNKITFTNEVNEDIFGIKVILDHDGVVEKEALGAASILFSDTNVSVLYGNKVVKSKEYNDFSSYTFSVNSSQLISDKIQFNGFLEEAFSLSYPIIYIQLSVVQILELLFSAMMLFFFIFLLTGRLNPQVKGIMRIRLLLSCFISYLALYWFYYVFDQNMLFYFLTFVIPYLYFVVALSNILRISKVVK